jgi:4-hydroxybenzoate polyprenyltransferase
VLAPTGLIASYFINFWVFVFVAIYLALNISYSLFLKHIPILDCFCIAAGFILRVYAGSMASEVVVSDWLFLTMVSMALFMAFGKRRGELINIGDTSTRIVLERYNLEFLKGMVFSCAGLTIVFYSLWAMSHKNDIIYTVPLVIFIVARYLLLIHDSAAHEDPTMTIFSDKTLMIACAVYAAFTAALLYSIW